MTDPVYLYVALTGTIIPDVAAIRTQVIQEYKNAFGQDLSVNPATVQGRMIEVETLARIAVARNMATIANQINPNLAGGVFLDSTWALTGGARSPDVFSVINNVTLAGEPTTVIPAESTAQLTTGEIFELTTDITLDVDGNGVGNFQAVEPGDIVAPIGSLTMIVNGPLGWETVYNSEIGTAGTETQSDESVKYFRKETLGLQGTSIGEAVRAAVMTVPGVRSNQYLENFTDSTIVKEDVTLLPHSIWVAVDGGVSTDVANALFNVKSAGGGWNGSVTVTIIDPVYSVPYTVSFERFTEIPILTRVTIKQGSSVADPVATVTAAILAYANGLIDEEPGLVGGVSVSPFEFASAISSFAPSIFVKTVEVKRAASGSFITDTLPMEIYEKATIVSSSISVIIE